MLFSSFLDEARLSLSADETARRTIEVYERHASLFERRASQASARGAPPFLRRTAGMMPKRARVLDFGCGSGHDAAWLAARGFRVTGVDAVPVFIERARGRCPQGRFFVREMRAFRSRPGAFELVWANASLIHVPKSALVSVLKELRRALVADGWLAATLHNGRGEGVHAGTWIPGRFFASYLKDELRNAVEAAGFGIIELRGVVNQDRKGRWLNLLARPKTRS